MARGYRDNTGWCGHCNARRFVRRRNRFFATWRCQSCGGAAAIVGERAVRVREEQGAIAASLPANGVGGVGVQRWQGPLSAPALVALLVLGTILAAATLAALHGAGAI